MRKSTQDSDMQEESRLQLTSIATNDVATSEIQQDMLSAENRGRQLVLKHVNSWFVKKDVLFFDSLKKNNTKTLKTMYQTKVQGKQDEQKVIKAHQKLLQRLLTASMAGRQIKMDEVLQHELSSLPLSLAKINGDMNSTSKSDMTDILMGDIEVQYNIPAQEGLNKTCVVIDGHALIQALGKPHNCKTFQDYAIVFFKAVTKHINATVKQIDALFDTYIENSIKAAAQAKRSNKKTKTSKSCHQQKMHSFCCAKVWLQANVSWQTVGLPSVTKGWELSDQKLKVVWTTKPSIPSSCINLISCGCTKKCNTRACKCYKTSQRCTPIYSCNAEGCKNPYSLE